LIRELINGRTKAKVLMLTRAYLLDSWRGVASTLPGWPDEELPADASPDLTSLLLFRPFFLPDCSVPAFLILLRLLPVKPLPPPPPPPLLPPPPPPPPPPPGRRRDLFRGRAGRFSLVDCGTVCAVGSTRLNLVRPRYPTPPGSPSSAATSPFTRCRTAPRGRRLRGRGASSSEIRPACALSTCSLLTVVGPFWPP
jgi:hypothetical protein